jgi:Cu+-exporting ATPase
MPEAVGRLRGLGIVPVLLTGDDDGAARGLATQLGIAPDDVRAEARREDRGAVVAALRARGRTVAVVGGLGDAEALAAADVALVEQPGEEAHVALDTLRLARRAARTVERVLTATAAHHVAALPVAAAGMLPPLGAAALAAVHPVVLVAWAAGLQRAPRRGGRRNTG